MLSMYALASYVDENKPVKDNIRWMADRSRKRLPDDSYSAKMYDLKQVPGRHPLGTNQG